MNFMLNGRMVTVRWVDVDTRGGVFGVAVAIDGAHVGIRRTMADALTLATIRTSGGGR